MKLSPYTIASNCTDINDCNAGLDELYEAYDHYKKTGKKEPAYIWSRVEKLEAKRDKCSLKEHGMKYDDYLLSLDVLGKTKKVNTSGIDGDSKDKVLFNFRNQLNQFFANTFVGRFIGVTMPKKILLDCGIPNLPIVIRPVQLKEKIVKHNLSKDVIKNLNTSINSPLLVFKSLTKLGAFNVIIEKQNEEGIICISLHPNKEIDKIEVTEIASIHGRNLDQLINWCENKALLYGNSDKTKKVFICSQFNSTKSEYLLSLIDKANINKNSNYQDNSEENLQGTYVSRFVEEWKKTNEKLKETIVGTYFFAKRIAKLYQQGEKLDWKKAQKIAKDFGIETDTEIMQACELGCVIEARRIAHNGNSLAQQYEEMKDLYDRQVNIKPLDTKSKVLNQYSTPCPLAYLLGTFVNQNHKMNDGKILEPSAGNGLLTTVFNPKDVCVNELDEIRVENLRKLGFYNVANIDASEKTLLDNEYQDKSFRGIITNPPFAKLPTEKKIQRNGWEINTLDYKMAVLALDKMNDNGRASIIVGGKMWNAYWKPLSETSQKQVLFGQWKTFLGYLYAQYNVVDVIYVDGDNIYRKQGTQYPIAIILIDGRHKYDESNKPRYVFDPDKDVIIQTYNQLFDRLFPYVETTQTSDDDEAKRKRAKALMLKMKMAKAKIEIEQTLEGIDEDFADKLNEFIIRGYKLTDRTDYFSCGYPQEVLQLCDLDANTEIVITQSGMQKILGVKKGKQDEAHDLTPIEILRLPQLLREPILVINGNTSDSRLIFIEIPRAGRKVFAVINVDSDMILKRKRNFYNLVASTYSQENFKISTKINQACATNSVWYYDSRKIKNWLSSMGELRLFPLLEANSLSNEKDVEPKTNIQ